MQNLFLNKLLGVFKCPVPLMHFDLAMTTMPLRLLKAKLLLYHHLATLSNKSLAKSILLIQERLNFYSIKNEVQSFLAKHEVVDITAFSKQKWKVFVNNKIASDNRELLIEQAKSYKKLDSLSLSCEDYKIKDYFTEMNLADSRLKFRIRSQCVNTCKTTCSSD